MATPKKKTNNTPAARKQRVERILRKRSSPSNAPFEPKHKLKSSATRG